MAKNDIITYNELKQRYGNIQRGINYGKGAKPTIILMSSRKDAPYVDKEGIDGQIVYEGEDVYGNPDRKNIDQVLTHQNLSLANTTIEFIRNKRKAEPVIIFEKLERNKWIDRGQFKLVGLQRIFDGKRYVYRFLLSSGEEETEILRPDSYRSRGIPSDVQKEVWKRDGGRCVKCGSDKNLHFDHIIPFSKGGSNTAENIQILCSKCNIKKSDEVGG
jgi:hypothetical protein